MIPLALPPLGYVINQLVGWAFAEWRLTLLFFLSGLLTFFGAPVFAAPYLAGPQQERLRDVYHNLAATVGGGWMLIRRTNGTLSLVKSKLDPNLPMEVVTLSGQRRLVTDAYGAMGRWRNRKFGIVFEGLGLVINPPLAEIGATLWDDADEDILRDEAEFIDDLEIDETATMVDPHDAIYAAPGEPHPADAETVNKLVEISQAGFRANPQLAYGLSLTTGALIGAGIVLFLSRYGGSGSLPSVGFGIGTLAGWWF